MSDRGHNSWPAQAVVMVSPGALKPSKRNARTHPAAQIEQLCQAIQAFGWTIPLLVDESGEVIAGHGRLAAALRMGLPEVPVMYARGWTADQRRAYMIADNKLALNAGWDLNLLSAEALDLEGSEFGNLMGFSEDDWQQLHDAAAGQLPSDGDGDGAGEDPGLSYRVVFDDESQRETWFQFLADLRRRYPGEGITVAARLVEHIQQHFVREGVEPDHST